MSIGIREMSTAERINLHVQQLPQSLQIEAIHFVGFLTAKPRAKAARSICLF